MLTRPPSSPCTRSCPVRPLQTHPTASALSHTQKQQVSDQEYSYHYNAALVTNHDSGTPVRVFRQRRLEADGGARGAPNDSSEAEARVVYV